MATLKRVTTQDMDREILSASLQLAVDAKKVLGYERFAWDTTDSRSLLEVLRAHDIVPFDPVSVNSYKNKFVKVYQRPNHIRAMFTGSLACLLAAVSVQEISATAISWPVLSCAVAGAGFMLVWTMLLLFDRTHQRARRVRKWQEIGISSYTHPIPEAILDKAVQIKKAVPECSISVHQLVTVSDDTDTARISQYKSLSDIKFETDPFLVVQLRRETYYIDVWDEHEYVPVLL